MVELQEEIVDLIGLVVAGLWTALVSVVKIDSRYVDYCHTAELPKLSKAITSWTMPANTY